MKRKPKTTPKNLVPGLVAAKLDAGDPAVHRQQLKELGFRVYKKGGGHSMSAKFEGMNLYVQRHSLAQLVALAQCVWTGLHE